MSHKILTHHHLSFTSINRWSRALLKHVLNSLVSLLSHIFSSALLSYFIYKEKYFLASYEIIKTI